MENPPISFAPSFTFFIGHPIEPDRLRYRTREEPRCTQVSVDSVVRRECDCNEFVNTIFFTPKKKTARGKIRPSPFTTPGGSDPRSHHVVKTSSVSDIDVSHLLQKALPVGRARSGGAVQDDLPIRVGKLTDSIGKFVEGQIDRPRIRAHRKLHRVRTSITTGPSPAALVAAPSWASAAALPPTEPLPPPCSRSSTDLRSIGSSPTRRCS
jgi:hypothetical protein